MYPKALALDTYHQSLRTILEELDTRHRDTWFEAVLGFHQGGSVPGKALCRPLSGEAIDIPDMQALVHPYAIKSHSQETLCVEGDCLASSDHLQAKLDVSIGAIIDPEQVDDAGAGADSEEASISR